MRRKISTSEILARIERKAGSEGPSFHLTIRKLAMMKDCSTTIRSRHCKKINENRLRLLVTIPPKVRRVNVRSESARNYEDCSDGGCCWGARAHSSALWVTIAMPRLKSKEVQAT